MDNQTDPAAPAATASADVPLRPAPSLSIFAAAPTLAPVAPQAEPPPDRAGRLSAAEPAMAATTAQEAQETAPLVAPPMSVAGLRSAGFDAQGALWRKIRGAEPRPSPAGSPPRRAPVVPPPGERPGVAAAASPPRGGRFAVLAASIALAAGAGAAAGGAAVAGIAWVMTPAPRPVPAVASTAAIHRNLAAETRILKDGLAQVRGSVRSVSDSIGGVRANIDNSGKATAAQIAKLNDQVAKLGDTVARLERAQSEPAAKLSKVIDTLEKLERRAATLASADAPETTGSVPAAKPVVRGAPPQPLQPPTVNGWVVRRVFDGVAMLDGPDRTIEVEPGDNIRGVGRVEDIQRQGNRWVVLTSRGMIVSR